MNRRNIVKGGAAQSLLLNAKSKDDCDEPVALP